MTAYWRALDTFVAEPDGVPHAVTKGAVRPESDPVVQHDLAHGNRLFARLDTGADEQAPAKSGPAKAAPKAEAAPVKAAASRGKP